VYFVSLIKDIINDCTVVNHLHNVDTVNLVKHLKINLIIKLFCNIDQHVISADYIRHPIQAIHFGLQLIQLKSIDLESSKSQLTIVNELELTGR